MDSDDYSTDDQTRKRKADVEVGCGFEKSKKTSRTPTRQARNEEDKLDKILELINAIKADQKETRNEQKEIRRDIREIGEQQKSFNEELLRLREENEKLQQENRELKKENVEMRKEIEGIKKSVEILEKERKRNNVVMNGLKMDTSDPVALKEGINRFLKQHIGLEIKPKAVTKIGDKTFVIELANEVDKQEIMRNKTKLKDLREMIFISNDLTKKEIQKQKQLRQIAKEEKEKGKDVKIGYNKIMINGEEWRWNNSTEKIEKAKTKNY